MIKLKTMLSEAGKFGRYSRYNDEPFDFRDDKTSLPKKTRPEWDAFVDKYNNIDGYETKTSSDGLSYDAEIKNIETGLRWVVQGRRGNNWNYIGRTVGYTGNPEFCRDAKELIANFEEINGIDESGIGGSESSIDEQIRTDIFFDDNNKFTNAILGMTLAETARIVFQIELYSKQLEQTYRSENISSERFKSNMDPEKQRRISLGIIDKFKKLLTTSINNIDAIKNNL